MFSLSAFFWALLFSQGVQAFTLNAENLRGWDKDELTFFFNPANCSVGESQIKEAIEKAIELWNSVPTSRLVIKFGGTTNATGVAANPNITCNPSFGNSSTVGLGTIGYSAGIIRTGGIDLNSQSGSPGNIASQSQTRLNVILAHEMGHVLGIGHSSLEPALMYFTLGSKANLALAQDDIDAITFLYPRQEPSNGDMFGCGLVETRDSPGTGGSGPATLVLGLLLVYLSSRLSRVRGGLSSPLSSP
jgi:hypothetical protein